ncbi:MAG: crossover junction endodeoxyribonuclease RuvC [Oscillospiraceae bacterium]|nr:crossover junction endodeoxyribonuclease RuvC [Oscillospiraceae bacterium]MBR2365655.1 crossover junction endodeoxyribonuclease RuvC [Oscillospiraceae bacterium]MBR2897362.1 crossover junction endodeoxyribonuclease RuvC [Oscillospiraceae bacterium]MBR2977825.1 crossover junction endodeoxyribonuclease RuvC [Oscillospiraceae bacterium]
MRILGIDPGYATIGFGLVDAERGAFRLLQFGTITTPADEPFPKRLSIIYDDMNRLLDALAPDVLSVEELFFGHNVTTGIGVSHGRGVILLSAEQHALPIFEYTPMQVKLAVCGYGKATKRQVMDMTRRLLNMQEVAKPDDAADAIALALCHARSATSLLSRM